MRAASSSWSAVFWIEVFVASLRAFEFAEERLGVRNPGVKKRAEGVRGLC